MKKAFIQLHIAIFLAGFTGILGKLITLNEGLLVWYRLMISSIALWVIYYFTKNKVSVSSASIVKIAGIGALAALHWVSFYGSIKYSNVSIALVCFSSVGFFTAIMEPLVFRVKIDLGELILGFLMIIGIYFIFHFDPSYKIGIIIGLVSAWLGSLFPILNKVVLKTVPATVVTLYEITAGFLFLSLLLPFYLKLFPTDYIFPNASDWFWLLFLSLLCTVLAFNLSMKALQKISAFTVNLSYNLEPVYGILLAFVVLKENKHLNKGFYIGFTLILFSIGAQMLRLWQQKKKSVQIEMAS
ncbi:MAG: DMT family transporter [Bacteroidetes bacterium]|nr:DMT family transporter [Bacteroidota bacterium]